MSEDNNKSIDKRLAEIKKNFVNNKSSEEKTLCTFTGICSFNLLILVIVFLLLLHYKALSSDLVAKVLSALIAVIGVFAGFYYNKREKYKEIVTKERIEWLHKMQENLSEYLVLTSSGKAKDIDRDKVRKLYYEIILNINHENDKEALDAIKTYNDYIFGRELVRNIKIRKGIIELESQDTHEVKKFTYYKYKKNFGKLRSNVEKSFAEIFKEVWENIKKEAD
ncbi:hypothetical protein [Peptoniphilus gorbachii]|uniref:DUF4760 domain-containing protein n=1 Tax=Peptoniphilus gorbachii TaxID=411567 RepID=A0ABS2MJM2_9FIRM|nr:hypothetical protein [Peptoniphilus gorbachii]MBM7550220.1 hypothetical protein [Peptoniphilus gorbachii]